MQSTFVTHDLILAGAGHANLLIAHYFYNHPLPGLRITLINPESIIFYSGRLSGVITQSFPLEACQIDLRQLCHWLQFRFVQRRITHIDTQQKLVSCVDYPDISYDILSINIATEPSRTPDEHSHSVALKPFQTFYRSWQNSKQRLKQIAGRRFRLAIVGGGLGSVEIALALLNDVHQSGWSQQLECSFFTDKNDLLPSFTKTFQNVLTGELLKKQIKIYRQHKMAHLGEGQMQDHQGVTWKFDQIYWGIPGQPASWLKNTHLNLSSLGYILVDDCLRALGQDAVFALGDIAEMSHYPLNKSGVYAVRMGQHTAKNIENLLLQKSLVPYKPQKNLLFIVPISESKAVASYANTWLGSGAWAWKWKCYLDQKYLNKFIHPSSSMTAKVQPTVLPLPPDLEEEWLALQKPQCGGCAAKVAADVLFPALKPFENISQLSVLPKTYYDDAVVVELPTDHYLVQSVDYLPILLDDPFIFGQIAATHALNDLYAMGAKPHSAQSILSLPRGLARKQQHELKHLLSGIQSILKNDQCPLLGGHTAISDQLAVGMVVNGILHKKNETIWWKSQINEGDMIILTKPLGSGILFAMLMLGRCPGAWLDNMLHSMLMSHQPASMIAKQYEVHAATDVSGFGLAGHLLEMISDNPLSIRLKLAQLQLYEGVNYGIQQNLLSSLHASNRAYAKPSMPAKLGFDQQYASLFDPQTAGGLLFSVRASQAEDLLQQLKQAGYGRAHIVAEVVARQETKLVFAE